MCLIKYHCSLFGLFPSFNERENIELKGFHPLMLYYFFSKLKKQRVQPDNANSSLASFIEWKTQQNCYKLIDSILSCIISLLLDALYPKKSTVMPKFIKPFSKKFNRIYYSRIKSNTYMMIV